MATEPKALAGVGAERSAEGHRECTRDPIFLFQRKIITWIGSPDGWDPSDDCGWVNRETGEDLCESEALERFKDERHGDYDIPCFLEHWETELVFLTRAEGEQFGRRKAYNYVRGWRVYCMPCEGTLAALLKEHAP